MGIQIPIFFSFYPLQVYLKDEIFVYKYMSFSQKSNEEENFDIRIKSLYKICFDKIKKAERGNFLH
jgi:hypothetical protein